MDNSFARVKSIIERLREVLKCQKCFQMKKEDLMIFFHICDHFYCVDCLIGSKSCLLCKNPLDKTTSVVNDKNILSLYQSLAKFELPSKDDIKKIYETHKESKEDKSKENLEQNEIQETPRNQTKSRLNLRERETRKNNLTSPIGTETIIVSSDSNEAGTTPNRFNIGCANPSTSGRGRKNSAQTRKGRSNSAFTTPVPEVNKTPVSTATKRKNNTSLVSTTATSKGSTSITKSNINKRNHKGETQLHLACKKSNFSLMNELIAAGANPNAQDNAGWTPLHDSVFSSNVEVIKFLLDNGAKVNAPGLENTTALHEAIAKGNVKIVNLLLDYGADVNAMNIFKETPLDLVTKYKLEEMKEILLKASNNGKKTSVTIEDPNQKLLLYKYNLSIEEEKLLNKFADKFEGEILSSLTSKTSPSHIVVHDEKIEMTWALISSVPKGCWVLTIDWIKDSLNENTLKSPINYEPTSSLFSGFSKARANKANQFPGLFSGCHFFFGGNFDIYSVKNLTIGKEDMKNLVEKNGGAIVKRCPDPESLALEKTVPFHASSTSSLRETCYFIIYHSEKWDPKPKYNMSHIKTLPIEWLVCCVLKFELIDPNDKEVSWTNIL